MTDAIRDNYELAKAPLQTSFLDGALPSWLTDASTGGGSISVESTNGGRVVLSAGTTASGDEGKIEANDISPGDFDAVSISVTFARGPNATGPSNALVGIGMEDSDASERLHHNNSTFVFGGVGDNVNTRATRHDTRISSTVFWDIEDQVGIHRLHNAFAVRKSDTSLDTDSTYIPFAKVITYDTAADRTAEVYDFEIAYWDKKDQ